MTPVSWMPRRRTIEQDILEEEARIAEFEKNKITEALWQAPQWGAPQAMPTGEIAEPVARGMPVTMPQQQWQPTAMPTMVTQPQAPVATAQPTISPIAKKADVETEVPFWQRALQVFAAPFEWVDEYVIKPSLSLVGTAVTAVPKLKREEAEDFWEWKRREWEAWQAPGLDINVPWSDEPWRIDFKGILEFAPWFLLPGAGQVGGGLRAARGIAGVAGRFGKAGKALGYAIEYSPWGIAEKTIGLALKKGLRGVAKGAERISERAERKVFGEIVEEPIPPVVQELSKFFDDVVSPARRAFEKAEPALRARQEAAIQKILAKERSGEITAIKATELIEKATAGAEKYKYAVPIERFTKEKVEDLLNRIYKSTETGFVKRDSGIALKNLLLNTGELPQPHHIRDWSKVFGKGFAESALKFSRLPASSKGQIVDALNLLRATLASGDLSATFRQGLILLLTRPQDAPRAFWRQLKAFASEKISAEMDDMLAKRPLYESAIRDGVEFTSFRKGVRMAAKEEPFFSNMAERLPMVRRSERAFTTFLNEMRMGSYEAAHAAMKAQGATAAQMKLMARFVNLASGRGILPKNLDQYAPVLNTVLFSARYQMSTLQLPRQIGRMLLSKNPYMRKEAAKAFITFVGGGATLVGLLNATKVGKVEIDPRSGDFGKIIVGDTRLDIWRGYVQYVRFAAQMLAGERKSAYGNMNKAQRYDIAFRFLQSKASPALGIMVDLLKGENFMGETLFEGTKGLSKTVRDRVMPLALQDVMDAMEQSGINGIWTAAPATLGIGVLTYINDFVRTKEKIARRMGYKSWDDIDPITQRRLENSNAELQVAFIEFDRQVMGTAWGDFRLAGKAIEDTFKENVGLSVAKYRSTGDGYGFREDVGDAFTARRGGYASREKMPQFEDIVRRLETKDTAEAVISLGTEQMAIRIYNDALYGDDMYDEFGDYRFELADERKQQLRQQLGSEMFEYVEQYRGLKYEDLPPEFQELSKARVVLKEYWRVKDWALKHFGTPKNEWQQRRLDQFISKVRKRLRATNPEIEKYIQMFYTQK